MNGKNVFTALIRDEVPDTVQAREGILRMAELQMSYKQPRYKRRVVVGTASLAVICVAIFGIMFLISMNGTSSSVQPQISEPVQIEMSFQAPVYLDSAEISIDRTPVEQGENVFVLMAYIPELQDEVNESVNISDIYEDSDLQGWIDLDQFDSTQVIMYGIFSAQMKDIPDYIDNFYTPVYSPDYNPYVYNARQYISIFIKGEMENVVNIEFTVEYGGSFKLATVLTEDGVPKICNRGGFTVLSQVALGSNFVIDDISDISEGIMLFVGKALPDGRLSEVQQSVRELSLSVQATATFTDGTTQIVNFVVSTT